MEIPDEIARRLVNEVDPKQLLSELTCFNRMTHERIGRIIDRDGCELGMKEIIKELTRFDHWDHDLVTALKSNSINRKEIAEEFSKLIRKKRDINCHLIHFEYFPCLDSLNDTDYSPNWEDLASKLGFSEEEITAINDNEEITATENKRFMLHVMTLAKEKFITLKSLLTALKALGLTDVYNEILEGVRFRQSPQQQNYQTLPRPTATAANWCQQDDHYQPSESFQSVDSYLNRNREEEKKGVSNKFSSSSSIWEKFPTDCTSIERPDCTSIERPDCSPSVAVIRDQENRLNKFTTVEKNINTIEGHSDPEDDSNVKATPTYEHSSFNEEQSETDSNANDYQHEDNSFNINVRNSDTSAAPTDESVNERISSDIGEGSNPDFKTRERILLGIIFIGMLAFVAHRYFRH